MKKSKWEFKEFKLEKMGYGEFAGQVIGKIKFEKDGSAINDNFFLSLTKEETKKMFEIVKDKMPDILDSVLKELN